MFEIIQPAIDGALAETATLLYAGKWLSADGNSSAIITVENGVLSLQSYMLEGVDALKMFFAPGKLALRSSGRRDEFRLASDNYILTFC